MTTPTEADRLIRAFLDEGQAELPDRAYEAVRSAIDRTSQRGGFVPRRDHPMPTPLRWLAAAAAVAAIAMVALVVRPPGPAAPSTGPSTGPSGSVAQSPTSSAAATASAIPVLTYVWPGKLVPGTYRTSMAWDLGFELLLTVPEGWDAFDIEVMRADRVSLSVQLVDNVYADPCAAAPRDPVVGPSTADLMAALRTAPGVTFAAEPRRSSRSGFDALTVEYTATLPDCGGGEPRLWAHDVERITPAEHHGPPWMPIRAGTHDVEIVDVNGLRVVIDAWAAPEASDEDRVELALVAESLRMLVAPPTATEGSCVFRLWSAADGRNLAAPYQVQMVDDTFDLLGPWPVDESDNPLTPGPPVAQLNMRLDQLPPPVEGAGNGRPSVGYVLPLDRLAGGFATSTTVNAFQGSVVFDAPGTWYVRIDALAWGCLAQFPVQVLPPVR